MTVAVLRALFLAVYGVTALVMVVKVLPAAARSPTPAQRPARRRWLPAGDLALWLGAALATANMALLAAWPLYLLGVRAQTDAEDEVLDRHFGVAYRAYSARIGRLVPRFG
jgi:protein-S-isoprenylcysteine O-methyltransferase Ste14